MGPRVGQPGLDGAQLQDNDAASILYGLSGRGSVCAVSPGDLSEIAEERTGRVSGSNGYERVAHLYDQFDRKENIEFFFHDCHGASCSALQTQHQYGYGSLTGGSMGNRCYP